MRYFLADTGFWIALFDTSDNYHSAAEEIFTYMQRTQYKVIVPRSILSELLRTKFFKGNKKIKIDYLEKILKSGFIDIDSIDDEKYKKVALTLTLNEGKRCRSISYVDNIIRLIIQDFHINIICLITFNVKDFIDVCKKHRVIIYEKCFI